MNNVWEQTLRLSLPAFLASDGTLLMCMHATKITNDFYYMVCNSSSAGTSQTFPKGHHWCWSKGFYKGRLSLLHRLPVDVIHINAFLELARRGNKWQCWENWQYWISELARGLCDVWQHWISWMGFNTGLVLWVTVLDRLRCWMGPNTLPPPP